MNEVNKLRKVYKQSMPIRLSEINLHGKVTASP